MLVVTGANGFLGSYVVCRLLKNGFSVKALKRTESDISSFNLIAAGELKDQENLLAKLVWEDADVTDILSLDKAFEGAEMVYHCAALISFQGNFEQLIKVNAEGTANVVNACLKAGVKKLIYASSTAAIGRSDLQAEITEESVWIEDKNNTLYAESKHLAELEVWRGMEEGLEAVIVNPGIILGAGNWQKGSCRLFENVFNGLKFYTKGMNGFVGVGDVANAMIHLSQADYKSERYLLISENKTYQDLFATMAKHLNVKGPQIEIKPSYLPWLRWLMYGYQFINPSSHLSVETLRTSLKKHQYSNKKIKDTGFKFTPLEEVIAETVRIYQAASG